MQEIISLREEFKWKNVNRERDAESTQEKKQ